MLEREIVVLFPFSEDHRMILGLPVNSPLALGPPTLHPLDGGLRTVQIGGLFVVVGVAITDDLCMIFLNDNDALLLVHTDDRAGFPVGPM